MEVLPRAAGLLPTTCLLLTTVLLTGCAAGPVVERLELEPGATAVRTFADGRPHHLVFSASAGEYLHLQVEQDGVDVVVLLDGPAGDLLYETDSPSGSSGAEEVRTVVKRPGDHTLRLEPFIQEASGRVHLTVAARRPATPADQLEAAASTALARAQRRRLADRPDDAVTAFRTAVAHLRAVGEGDPRLATAHWHLGEALTEVGELRQAEEALGAALAAFVQLADSLGQARVWTDLGGVQQSLGDLAAAEQAHRRALTLYRDLDNPTGTASAHHNLALALSARGDYGEATHHLRQSLEIWRELGRPRSEAMSLKSLGSLHVRLGREEEGLDLLRQALDRLPVEDRRGRRAILVELGWSHHLSGRPQEALQHYDEALELARALEGPIEQAAVLGRRASALRQVGRTEDARRDYRDSLTLAEQAGSRLSAGHTRANLGWLELESGDPAGALEHFAAAAKTLSRAGEPGAEAYARLGTARALRQLSRWQEAHRELESAVALLDELRTAVPGALSRSHYVAVRYDAYEELATLELELHRRNPGEGHHRHALEVAERSRARSLLELLPTGAGEERSAGHQRNRLLREIRALEQRRLDLRRDHPEDPRVAELESRIRLNWLEVETLTAAPAGERQPLGATGIQELLDDDTLLIVYLLAEPQSIAWTVDRRQIQVHRLPGREAVEHLARRAVERVRSGGSRTRESASLALESLSEALLAPLTERVAPFPRLAIMADGALHAVPFAALPTADGEPLLVHHELVGLPSATVLHWQRRYLAQRPAPRGLAAVVADPVFTGEDQRVDGRSTPTAAPPRDLTRALEDLDLRRLERLIHTGGEAEAILELLPTDRTLSALGFAADRQVVTDGRLADYRVLHFATHGLVHPVHPELSGLVLSLVDRQGRAQDGFLRAHEVAELDLAAELVVLSACRTGMGRDLRGEGLVGLTHAFFRAGVRRVVMSRWNVDDQATAVLMERFYRYLWQQELPPAAALRRAQLDLRSEAPWRAPFYWAAFELQGDWQ